MPRLIDHAIAAGSLARLRQPVLDLSDFVLRPWRASDVPAVAPAYSEPSIQRWHVRSMTEDEARAWVELIHSTRNPASCRVAENAGYKLEGTKRREALHADGWHDMHLHARLIDDPQPDRHPGPNGPVNRDLGPQRPRRTGDKAEEANTTRTAEVNVDDSRKAPDD